MSGTDWSRGKHGVQGTRVSPTTAYKFREAFAACSRFALIALSRHVQLQPTSHPVTGARGWPPRHLANGREATPIAAAQILFPTAAKPYADAPIGRFSTIRAAQR
jgi:hypothetical protein